MEDWDAVQALVDFAVVERMQLSGGGAPGVGAAASPEPSLRGHPVLMAEHANASKLDREKWVQILFETYGAPGVFMSRSGVLALYANARTSGLVVDMGAGGTQLTPVQDGYALMMGARVHGVGGAALDAALAAAVQHESGGTFARRVLGGGGAQQQQQPLLTSALDAAVVGGPGLTIAQWRAAVAARDLKETVCRVADSAAVLNSAGALAMSTIPYELPDGTVFNVGVERQAVPERVFTPAPSVDADDAMGGGGGGGGYGLPDTLAAAIVACNPEVRKDLAGNLVLTGGASLLPGLHERLVREVAALAPTIGARPRWAAASRDERQLGVWLGGSILGSMDTFADLWFSAAEYAEHGAKFIHRKCP